MAFMKPRSDTAIRMVAIERSATFLTVGCSSSELVWMASLALSAPIPMPAPGARKRQRSVSFTSSSEDEYQQSSGESEQGEGDDDDEYVQSPRTRRRRQLAEEHHPQGHSPSTSPGSSLGGGRRLAPPVPVPNLTKKSRGRQVPTSAVLVRQNGVEKVRGGVRRR